MCNSNTLVLGSGAARIHGSTRYLLPGPVRSRSLERLGKLGMVVATVEAGCPGGLGLAIRPRLGRNARSHCAKGDLDGILADCDRRFDFVMSYDRSLVTAAARNLLDRML